jgi:hypothetical protein
VVTSGTPAPCPLPSPLTPPLRTCIHTAISSRCHDGHLGLEELKEEHSPHLDHKHFRVAIQDAHHLGTEGAGRRVREGAGGCGRVREGEGRRVRGHSLSEMDTHRTHGVTKCAL